MLRYSKLQRSAELLARDVMHTHFTAHLYNFWAFMQRAYRLLRNRRKRLYFVDSTFIERVGYLHEFLNFRIFRFARGARYVYQSRIRTFFLRAHCARRVLPPFFFLQLKSKRTRVGISVRTHTSRLVLFLRPGLFCALLRRPKSDRASRLVRLVLFKHLAQLLQYNTSSPLVLEVVGLPLY